MVLRNGPVIRNPHNLPAPGTPAGDRARALFIAQVLSLGKVDFFWLPKIGDTTTTTTEDLDARTVTYSESLATFDTPGLGQLGSASFVEFNGTDEDADSPDTDDLSYVSGGVDQAMTILSLVNPTDATPTADATIVGKWNEDTDGELREYRALLSATNGYPRFEAYDDTNNGYIGREDQTALTAGAWDLLGFTYNGSGVSNGVGVYVKDAKLDDADSASGTYASMVNAGGVLSIAHNLSAASTPVPENWWAGGIAFIIILRKALAAIEMEMFKSYVTAFTGETL